MVTCQNQQGLVGVSGKLNRQVRTVSDLTDFPLSSILIHCQKAQVSIFR
jgi:hypothetical protein